MRALAEAAGLPAATIQYQFGSKARLLVSAFSHLSERHARRLDAFTRYFAQSAGGYTDLTDVMICTLGLGDREERREQLAMFEFMALALRSPPLFPIVESWTRLLADFWQGVAARNREGAAKGTFLFELHLGLILHMSGSEPPMEGQLLAQEIVSRALSPVERRRAPIWFRSTLRNTLASPLYGLNTDIPHTPTARQIVDAAKGIAIDEGPGALSFRTVATRAETSVSAIAHYFPTRHALLYATYRAIHEEIIAFTGSLGVASDLHYDSELAERIAVYSGNSRVSLLVAYSEFELIAARDPEFSALARYFRMTRGFYHTLRHDPAFDAYGDEAFDMFALSFWMAGHSLRMALHRRQPDQEMAADPEAVSFGFRQFALQ